MDNLEAHVYLKIRDIVEKLHKLDCILLGNKDDSWIMELLFKPGLHRINLIEWAISKHLPLRKENDSLLMVQKTRFMHFELQESAENRVENLKSIISDMGICRENISDIVEGTAVLKEQLQFWSTLVDIIWLKYQMTSAVSKKDSILISPKKSVKRSISEEFEEACSSVVQFCESGNMQHIFMRDLPLLAPDVETEMEKELSSKSDMLEISPPEELGELAKEDNPQDVLSEIYKKLCTSKIPVDEINNDCDAETELNKLEEELLEVATDLQKIAKGTFIDSHNSLKYLISNVKADDFVDVGPAFQNVEHLLKDFSRLIKSFPKMMSANSTLSKANSELEDLLNHDTLVDESYTNTFKLLKDEN